MIVAFSGHRPSKIGGYDIPNPTYNFICQKLEELLKELQPEKAISGVAVGFDQYAANVCIKLEIPWIAAVPFIGQESKWPAKSQAIYKKLLSKACETIVVCEGEYAAWKMQKRNEWMVDNCDLLIGVWDGSPGGTNNCVQYAKSKNKPIIIINPKTKEVSR